MSVAEAGSQQRAASTGDQEAGEPAAGQSFLVTLVVLTFVMNMLARGVTETFAVFLLPVQNGLGISRADITLTYSVYMLAYGLSAPFAGQLIDRLGARITYGFGLTMLGLGYVLAGSATELWHYLLTVGLLGGLGSASLGMIVASALLSRWFTTRIGAVMSLAVRRCRRRYADPAAADAAAAVHLRLAYDASPAGRRRAAGAAAGDAAAARAHDGRLDRLAALRLEPPAMERPMARLDGHAHQRLLGAVRRLSVHLGCGLQRPAALGGLSRRAGLQPADRRQRLRHDRHAVGDRHPRASAGCPTASAGGSTATVSYLSTMLGIVLPILVSGWHSLLLVYGFVLFFGLMQGARGPIIVAMVAMLFPGGGVGAIYGTLSLALGLGAGDSAPGSRACSTSSRAATSPRSWWRWAARWPGSPPSGWCAVCARRRRANRTPPPGISKHQGFPRPYLGHCLNSYAAPHRESPLQQAGIPAEVMR